MSFAKTLSRPHFIFFAFFSNLRNIPHSASKSRILEPVNYMSSNTVRYRYNYEEKDLLFLQQGISGRVRWLYPSPLENRAENFLGGMTA